MEQGKDLPTRLKLRPEPVLSYTNPAGRGRGHGAMFVWTQQYVMICMLPLLVPFRIARARRRYRPTGPSAGAHRGDTARQHFNRVEAAFAAPVRQKTPAVVEAAMRYEADLSILVDQHHLAEHHALPEIGAPEANLVAVSAQESSTSSEAPALASVGQVDECARRGWLDAVACRSSAVALCAYHKYIAALKDKRATLAAPSKAERNNMAEAAAKLQSPATPRSRTLAVF